MKPSVVLIGAGNVGFHLAVNFLKNKINLIQVFTRNSNKKYLEHIENQIVIENDFTKIHTSAALYLIAVKDDAIESVAAQLAAVLPSSALVAHTSGACPSTVFQMYFSNYGVFYPLQTLSIQRTPNFQQIPFCIDASNEFTRNFLTNLAQKVSNQVYQITDEDRGVLHVAAVFANNFTNHLMTIATDILSEQNLPKELLLPLLEETVQKLKEGNPREMQTGPAVRKDEATIQRHLTFLQYQEERKTIYETLTKSIQKLNK